MKKIFECTRLKFLVSLIAIYTVWQFFLRIILTFVSTSEIEKGILTFTKTFLLGFGYDVLVVLYLLLPLAFLLFLKDDWLNKNFTKKIMLGMLWFFSLYSAFVLVSEYYFWEEFHTRYNFIAVDYLIYTQELFGNIFESYSLFILIAIVIFLAFVIYKSIKLFVPQNFTISNLKNRLLGGIIYILLLIFGTLSLTSDTATLVCQNVYNQELARNGVYQFVYAYFNNELDYNRFYRHREEKSALEALRAKMALDGGRFVNRNDLTRNITNHNNLSGVNPNICVIVVESLSAKYTGMDGNKNSLTPRLDALAKKSFCYTNVYATGTRTVRGLEAITLSLPPTPGQSIIRRPDCIGFHTVGTTLRGHGYATEFDYGGYGYFDNMNEFFQGNEFDIFDRNNIPSEKIFNDTVWGVADEILFDEVINRLDKQAAEKEPVFQIVLTTTNHRPFTFPEGRIDAPQGKRDSVVVYTDWAIDNFLKKCEKKSWFNNTVFVILADHNALAAGKVELPVNSYKIPCLIYSPNLIKPGQNNRLMSQIDVLPTVLGMLGFSYQSKNLGYDINKLAYGAERAFISTYQQMGFIKGNKLVVLSPGNKAQCYHINNFLTSDYTPLPEDQNLIDEAITWYQGANILYKKKLMKE